MSFIGNIAAAQSAKALGKYNQSVAYQEAAYERKKAAIREKVYNQIERPRFLDQQEQAYSNFFVSALGTGAEYREGTTPFFVGLRNKQNIINEIAMADYNNTVSVNDLKNQSILLQAKASGERFKGEITRSAAYAKAGGSLLTIGYNSNKAGRLVL